MAWTCHGCSNDDMIDKRLRGFTSSHRPWSNYLRGSGTGYLTAVMAYMVSLEDTRGRAVGVEHIAELVSNSLTQVKEISWAKDMVEDGRLILVQGDGREGFPSGAPFDCIHVGAAAPNIPRALTEQLKPGGRLLLPVGPEGGLQSLTIVDKLPDGKLKISEAFGVTLALLLPAKAIPSPLVVSTSLVAHAFCGVQVDFGRLILDPVRSIACAFASYKMKQPEPKASFYGELMIQYGYMLLWIALSASVILVNKYILSVAGFPYPLSLTLTHMGFGSILAYAIVHLRLVEAVAITTETYVRCILPIGFLFAGTLWLGNAAYLYLSVSFIQMLKALMPMAVFLVGVLFGTEAFNVKTAANMVVVGVGVAIASYGEVMFVAVGVVIQLASICTESVRLTLVQILLQKRGIKMNPISTLYYISPCCFGFLTLPFLLVELPKMWNNPTLVVDVPLLLMSATIAFCLNMSVFLLIGKTSALTMNVAGVIKDWLLIGLSVLMFGTPVTGIQLAGYGLAFLGVCYYNYIKVTSMSQASASQAVKVEAASDEEKGPLLVNAK
eukprot:gene1689-33086_t